MLLFYPIPMIPLFWTASLTPCHFAHIILPSGCSPWSSSPTPLTSWRTRSRPSTTTTTTSPWKGWGINSNTQPLSLPSGKRESGARPAQEHKTCAIVTNLEARGWRKPTRPLRRRKGGAGAALLGANKTNWISNSSFLNYFLRYMGKLVISKTKLV